MLDDVLSASTHPSCPSLSKGDAGLPGASLRWPVCAPGVSPSSLMSPIEQSRGAETALLPHAGQVSSPLRSEHVAAAIPPSPVPTAPFLPSCRALIDAVALSPGPTNTHLYPLPAAPTLSAHRAAGKRAASRCQAAPAQLTPADFGAVRCQSLLQLIFPLPGSLPSSLGHVLGRIHRSRQCPTEHLVLRLGCISQHLFQVAGYQHGCCLHI